MVKLVAVDLDGTIIDSNGVCDDSVSQCVRRLKEKGILFAISSGRPVASITPLLEGWHLDGLVDFIIGSNGGEVYEVSTGKMEIPYVLSPELIREIIDLYEPIGLIPTLYQGAMFYAQELNDTVLGIGSRVHQVVKQGNIRELTVEPQIKVMFVVEPENMEEAEKFMNEHPDPRYIGFKTARDLLEFNHYLLGKHTGMEIIGKMRGIDAKDMIAFGDTTNDITMLEYAGIGVCMANGTQDAKDAADEIALSVNEKGFSKFMEKYL